MTVYRQRKRFVDRQEAERAAATFLEPRIQVRGIQLRARVLEHEGAWRVYLTQEGELITSASIHELGATFPGYERVP